MAENTPKVTPATVRVAMGLSRQRARFAAERARLAQGRANGYKGPLTRAELAAQARRDNSHN